MLDNENIFAGNNDKNEDIAAGDVSAEDTAPLDVLTDPEQSPTPCPSPQKKKHSAISAVLDYSEIFVFSIAFVVILFSFFFRICNVDGPSMEKTLLHGETLLVSDIGYKPERGDIIVFHQTGALNEAVVKRVIATGGETIDIDFHTWTVTITDKDGNTFILEEPYMNLDESYPLLTSDLEFPYLVPEGQLFVMGDNRNRSSDSRGTRIGLVDERRVLGKVIFRISPLDKFGAVK